MEAPYQKQFSSRNKDVEAVQKEPSPNTTVSSGQLRSRGLFSCKILIIMYNYFIKKPEEI